MREGFLGRWSRLKQTQAELAEPAETSDTLPAEEVESEPGVELADPQVSADEASVDPALGDPAELTDIDMPDLATINASSDMSMFFSGGVSTELRRQALRKFFHQPEFNVRDPLDDYALDYSNPDKLVQKVGDTVRSWAQQQMDDAMQQGRDALLQSEASATADSQDAAYAVQPEDPLGASSDVMDSTKVDEADQLVINDPLKTK